jgi:hypothetical protein
MPFDPALPANNSQVSSSELRNQFSALKDEIDSHPTAEDVLNSIYANSAALPAVTLLSQSISNPPTQAQVAAIQAKINELIQALEVRP